MSETNIILLIIIISTVVFFASTKKTSKDVSISNAIIVTGLGMLSTSMPKTFTDFVLLLLGKSVPNGVNPYVKMICGFILLIFGMYYRKNLKEKTYVLNMHGLIARDISDENAIKELELADYKVKEQIIDFIPYFNKGQIDAQMNNFICLHIKKDVNKFTSKITDNAGCFTGMAPIPYTIYAGTYMGNAKIKRYFEYDSRSENQTYYELKNATKKQKKKGWGKLKTYFPNEINAQSSEIVLAISISHMISDGDLSQFDGKDIVRLELDNTDDNVIRFKEQLGEYSNKIYQCINKDIDGKYPTLQKIHLVASIPSCVSIEIGKSFGLRQNRNVNIVSYHFLKESSPHYKFGIYLNGKNKGKYVEG